MDTVDPLEELYRDVLKDIWLLIQLNDYRHDGIVYLPKDDNDRNLMFRLENTDHVLTIWYADNYPPKFAGILARIKPGSYILDIIPDKFAELCKKYNVFEESTVSSQSVKYNSRELDNEVTKVFRIKHFGRLEKKLLRYLSSNLRFKTKGDIVKEIGTCDFAHLICRVKEKLKRTGLKMNIERAKHLGEDSKYQLEFIGLESDTRKLNSSTPLSGH
jgi:hypothetical protein